MSRRSRGSRDVAHDTDAHAHRVARQVGERHVLALDRMRSVARSAPAATARSLAMSCAAAIASTPGHVLEDLVALARHLRDGGAHGIGAIAMLDMDDLARRPAILSGIRNAPPPTAISGTSPASVFMRSIAFFRKPREPRRRPWLQVAASRWATFVLSPRSRTPEAIGHVRGRELRAAEGDGVVQQAIAHGDRARWTADRAPRGCRRPGRSTAGRACGSSAHAADLDHRIGLAREAVLRAGPRRSSPPTSITMASLRPERDRPRRASSWSAPEAKL